MMKTSVRTAFAAMRINEQRPAMRAKANLGTLKGERDSAKGDSCNESVIAELADHPSCRCSL
jgi:hypothetical protein